MKTDFHIILLLQYHNLNNKYIINGTTKEINYIGSCYGSLYSKIIIIILDFSNYHWSLYWNCL